MMLIGLLAFVLGHAPHPGPLPPGEGAELVLQAELAQRAPKNPPPLERGIPDLDLGTAERFAKLALACIDREFPNKPEHVLDSAADAKPPREFHPAFFGCYDWHSSVHGHWMLVRLLKKTPEISSAREIRARLGAHFTQQAMATEAKYLDVKSNRSFERTYGWAWILRLAAELKTWNDPDGKAWSENLAPLTNSLLARLKDFLPKLASPIRSGIHPNTAFALGEALDYARTAGDGELEKLAVKRSREYYEKDRACPIAYEPSGEDFFSPCLEEADLMRRVLSREEFGKWLSGFLPGLAADKPFPLSPAVVTDPTDPRLVHLDGVNLTRAWTLNSIGRALPASDPRRRVLEGSAGEHARAGMTRVSSGNYEGEHWLASFAVYLLTDAGSNR
jgi:hypothetical protein